MEGPAQFAEIAMDVDTKGLKDLLRDRGKTQKGLAEVIGRHPSAITKLFKGQRKLEAHEAIKIATWLRVPVEKVYLLFGAVIDRTGPKFQVRAYVGAGGQITPFDDHEFGGLYEVEAPPGLNASQEWVVLEVKGDSMYPQMESGWLVWFSRNHAEDVPEGCINKLCVIELDDGSLYVKRLRRGSEPGRFHLESVNASLMENRPVKWASRIRAITPV